LKVRRVIAQGWRELGDLSRYARSARLASSREAFETGISNLCIQHYGDDDGRASKGLWRFFQIAAGDLVVAIEGTTVRGVTQALTSADDGYWLDPRFPYAQCIGNAQCWIDWDYRHIARTPTAPAQGVLAASQIRNERGLVFAAWRQLTRE
jgi:hypothetical protein